MLAQATSWSAAVGAGCVGLADPAWGKAETKQLKFRLLPESWGDASLVELEKVLLSAGGTLWGHFPGRELPRFLVQRGKDGPIVHFKKNIAGETVMELDAEGRRWAQFSYQFAHEFTHILAHFDEDWTGNLWFEETLCETASLFALRTMGRQWRENPIYPNWASYSATLEGYAADVIKSRPVLSQVDLAGFVKKHRDKLQSTPINRAMNGAMAVPLLPLFEALPSRWEAITWLNSRPSQPGESFGDYMDKWEAAAPARHTGFVRLLRKLFVG